MRLIHHMHHSWSLTSRNLLRCTMKQMWTTSKLKWGKWREFWKEKELMVHYLHLSETLQRLFLNSTICFTSYKDAFYEMYKVLQIACTIPVSSSEAERSFSCLKLIETHLRTTMAEQRLSDLAVLSIHKDRAKMNLDAVVDKFVQKYPNCRISWIWCRGSPIRRAFKLDMKWLCYRQVSEVWLFV